MSQGWSGALSGAIQCYQPLKQWCVINVILIPNGKHSALPPVRKKTNSIPAKTRALAVYNCLKSFFLVGFSEYTQLQFGMWLKVDLGMPRIKKLLTGRSNNNNVFLSIFIYFTLRCGQRGKEKRVFTIPLKMLLNQCSV